MRQSTRPFRFGECGATVVEFALVTVVLLTLLFGFIQFGIVLYVFNSAAQATRQGARVAVVNSQYAGVIVTEMQYFLPNLAAANVVICYPVIADPPGEYVVVRLAAQDESDKDSACNTYKVGGTPYVVSPWFFWLMDPITVPGFETWLPRESLGSG